MVMEAPDLAAGGHPEVVALSEQAHRPIKQPLLQAQPPGQVAPEQQQQVGPVGGEGQRHLPAAPAIPPSLCWPGRLRGLGRGNRGEVPKGGDASVICGHSGGREAAKPSCQPPVALATRGASYPWC
jgi:hypothetical protein